MTKRKKQNRLLELAGSPLAALAALEVNPTRQALTFGVAPPPPAFEGLPQAHKDETTAQFQARLRDRVERIKRKITGWDRDELADRYAWMLLLALQLRETQRSSDAVLRSLKSAAGHYKGVSDTLAFFGKSLMESNYKARRGYIKQNMERQRQTFNDVKAWREKAGKLWATRQHAGKSASEIARLIDPKRWNTVRRYLRAPEK